MYVNFVMKFYQTPVGITSLLLAKIGWHNMTPKGLSKDWKLDVYTAQNSQKITVELFWNNAMFLRAPKLMHSLFYFLKIDNRKLI